MDRRVELANYRGPSNHCTHGTPGRAGQQKEPLTHALNGSLYYENHLYIMILLEFCAVNKTITIEVNTY